MPNEEIQKANDVRKFVRAFIVNITMPKTPDEVLEEALEETYFESNRYDIEGILQGSEVGGWTVPKWAKPGDIILFMLARTSDYTVKCLKRDYEKLKEQYAISERNVIELMLLRAQWLVDNYAGKVIATGCVASFPYIAEASIKEAHYKSRIFADITDIELFDRPVDISEFSEFIRIGRGVTITPVLGRNFERLRGIISDGNHLPVYFKNAMTVPEFCRNIGKDNWMDLAEEHRRSFMLEDGFRSCYLDYLLEDLTEGNLYRECRFVKNKSFGFADNVILLSGKYLPVEAKLNIQTESNLIKQLNKYCHVRTVLLNANEKISGRQTYNDNVLVFDTEAAYLFTASKKTLSPGLFRLSECKYIGRAAMRSIILNTINNTRAAPNQYLAETDVSFRQ